MPHQVRHNDDIRQNTAKLQTTLSMGKNKNMDKIKYLQLKAAIITYILFFLSLVIAIITFANAS
jgi:hypothetical protein